MVGYIIAIVNVYILELAWRCQGPSLADLSSTSPPPLLFVYTSGAPAAFSSRLAGAYHDLHITNSARHTPTSKPHPAPHPAPIPPYLNAEAQCATKGLTLPLSRSGIITLNLYRTEKGNCNDLQGGIGGCGTGCDGLTGLKRFGDLGVERGKEGSRWLCRMLVGF